MLWPFCYCTGEALDPFGACEVYFFWLFLMCGYLVFHGYRISNYLLGNNVYT